MNKGTVTQIISAVPLEQVQCGSSDIILVTRGDIYV